MKVERCSYDVITPSAARGMLEAVYWHPGMKWVIDKIYVRKPKMCIRDRVRGKIKEMMYQSQNLGKNSAFIFLGGYKGLLLSKVYGDADPLNGGIYIDRENNLPHGLVKISLERRSDD